MAGSKPVGGSGANCRRSQNAVAASQVHGRVRLVSNTDRPHGRGGVHEIVLDCHRRRRTCGDLFLCTRERPAGERQGPQLHVNDAYRSCFFDLHPELTQQEFEEFAGELGSILRFRQLGDTTTVGRGKVELSVQFASASIDDSKGAWNNTMSHPKADHYLGGSIAFPRIVARFGVSDRVDVGVWGGLDPRSNYGVVGVDTTIALMRQGDGRPVSVSVRPSFTSLLGPREVWAGNVSVDISVSRAFGALSPYAGVSASSSIAVERSEDVALDPATAARSLAYAGVSYRWRSLMFSAEVEKGDLVSYGFRVGRRF